MLNLLLIAGSKVQGELPPPPPPEPAGSVFITLDPILESHYLLDTPMVCEGDFHWKVITSTATGGYLFANSVGSMRVALTTSGALWLASDSGGIYSGYVNPAIQAILGSGRFHEIILERIAGKISLYIDGVRIFTRTNATTFTLNSIGSKKGGSTSTQYWEGVIRDVKLINNLLPPEEYNLGNATGITEQSLTSNATLTYINIPETLRDVYVLESGNWVSDGNPTIGDVV